MMQVTLTTAGEVRGDGDRSGNGGWRNERDEAAMAMRSGERALRLAIYCKLAAEKLGDKSYTVRCLGRDICEVSDREVIEVTAEIGAELVKAGIIGPDEDPFDTVVATFNPATGSAKWKVAKPRWWTERKNK